MSSLESMQPFQGAEHQPFSWESGAGVVVLVHGFPGSPAELRPIALELDAAGWSTRGVLLPGFGRELPTLSTRRAEDWIACVASAVQAARERHERVILLGFSMGAAVSLCAAQRTAPDALILVAPFWRLLNPLVAPLWPIVRRLMRRFHPFRHAQFNDPNTRRSVRNFFPDADLDDPGVQRELRRLAVPISPLEQLRRVGRQGFTAAPKTATPLLVVQGTQDKIVPARFTRRLVGRLPGPLRYEEVVGGHDLLRPIDPGWAATRAAILGFLAPRQPATPTARRTPRRVSA